MSHHGERQIPATRTSLPFTKQSSKNASSVYRIEKTKTGYRRTWERSHTPASAVSAETTDDASGDALTSKNRSETYKDRRRSEGLSSSDDKRRPVPKSSSIGSRVTYYDTLVDRPQMRSYSSETHTSPTNTTQLTNQPSSVSLSTTFTQETGSSGSTMTQERFNRSQSESLTRNTARKPMETISDSDSPRFSSDEMTRRRQKYHASVTDDDGRESHSSEDEVELSSSRSDSSQGPGTPSSRSTFPSPTAERMVHRSDVDSDGLKNMLAKSYDESYDESSGMDLTTVATNYEALAHSPPPQVYVQDYLAEHDALRSSQSSSVPSQYENAARHWRGPPSTHQYSRTPPSPRITGYDSIAAAMCDPENDVKPIYRRFDYLNNRILLHLQDELSELEDALRYLDDMIAQRSVAVEGGRPIPSSRRREMLQGDYYHHSRCNLLGSIFIKTEQYSRAMAAHGKLKSSTTQPEQDDIEAYQRFLETDCVIDPMEAKFIEKRHDLCGFPTRSTDWKQVEETKPWWETRWEMNAIQYFMLTLIVALLSRFL